MKLTPMSSKSLRCVGGVCYSSAPQLIKVAIYNCIETLPHCTLGGDGRADLVSCFVLASTIQTQPLSFLCLQPPTHHSHTDAFYGNSQNFTVLEEGPSPCQKHLLLSSRRARRRRPCRILIMSQRIFKATALELCSAPSVPQPVVQSRRRPLLGPSPG